MTLTLKELLQGIESDCPQDLSEIQVRGLTCDSRQVKPGFVFFAVSGTKESGFKFVQDAENNGAVVVIHDTDNHRQGKVPYVHVNHTRQVMCQLAARFYGHPSRDFYLTGVTGTNGKTTFTYLVESFAKEKSGVIGTVKIRFADRILDTSHTTPEAIALQEVFHEMKKSGVKRVAMEVSSHALDQRRAHWSHFDSVVFTNLTQDHLDFHGDMENYFQAKLKLFTECLLQSEKQDRLAVINSDSPYGPRIMEALRPHPEIKTETYSCQKSDATLFLARADYSFGGTRATLKLDGKDIELLSNLIGQHNVQNIMAALLVGRHQGFSVADMLEKLKNVRVPGRLERVGTGHVFVDYAHTPDALENVVGALKKLKSTQNHPGRIMVLFGCGGDRDQGKRPLMGEVAAKNADVVFLTSDNPRTEDPRDIINDILEGVIPHQDKYDGKRGYLIEADRETALEEMVKLAGPDDIVLVAGKGHEDYQIIGTEKRFFDDREILAGLLK